MIIFLLVILHKNYLKKLDVKFGYIKFFYYLCNIKLIIGGKIMIKQKIELELIGFEINGVATLNLWGGGQGDIKMDPVFIPKEEFSKTTLLQSINDGGFGCESIESAIVSIYAVYSNGDIQATEFLRRIDVDYIEHIRLPKHEF